MTEETCRTCAMKSDAVNTRAPNYCYQWDREVGPDDPGCEEWRGSLRSEPLADPPVKLSDLKGIAPGLTEGSSSEEFVRKQRDDDD